MKCKKCKKEMELMESDTDIEKNILSISLACVNCKLWVECKWDLNKPQKVKWFTLKQYKKEYL